ncbi:hypothetical protein [Asticcacaulis biprosthecium]|uniref:hypothetical protein n=1 Tax=Asticcacaulis biprosthecium TaxID=76891 RepID=UPI0012F4F1AD|nr:hypothetical protein [Asticcacaulis biprosthecium]
MKYIVRSALALCTFFYTSTAMASICVDGRVSLEDDYSRSQYVVSGTVVSKGNYFKKYFKYDGRLLYDEYQKITVRVDVVYKGHLGRKIAFYNSNDSSRVPVEVGDKWLFFFQKSDDWEGVYVDTCGSSGALAKPDIAAAATMLKDRIAK